jgi:hypothetical protein
MDVHIRRAVVVGLRLRGVDVVTAQEDGTDRLSDPLLLDRATGLNRVLFTHDTDLLSETARRSRLKLTYRGVVYAHPLKVSIGRMIDDLELLATATDLGDWENRLEYLPLR